jgi:hypothetical protein
VESLRLGSVGQAVKNAQNALNYHLPDQVPPLAPDGVFGPKTLARVVCFQDRRRLDKPPKGVIGPQTHQALFTFVECRHHVAFVPRAPRRERLLPGIDGELHFDPPPLLPVFQLPFPSPFKPVPPLAAPHLKLDPLTLLGMRRIEFELESGKETTFSFNLHSHEREREAVLFTEMTANVWSKPLGEHVEISAGPGIGVEKRIGGKDFEASAFVFAKMEVKDVLKIGPLDLAKLCAEAQYKGPLGRDGPPEMSVGAALSPEVSLFHDRLSFGPSAYAGLQWTREGVKLSSSVTISGAYHFK